MQRQDFQFLGRKFRQIFENQDLEILTCKAKHVVAARFRHNRIWQGMQDRNHCNIF
jgi:hypothetical protein